MIGVFDSGVGGLAAYKELRALLPRADMVYLADRENAPYGTKTKEEIIRLVKRDVSRLKSFGCKKILMACCTASSVYTSLDADEKEICLPIITPAARLAAKHGKIAIIATERTVNSQAFQEEILSLSSKSILFAKALPELVTLVEEGLSDEAVNDYGRKYLDKVAKEILSFDPDALILGCTHFSRVEKELKKRLPRAAIISPAKEGARAMARLMQNDKSGVGRDIYL